MWRSNGGGLETMKIRILAILFCLRVVPQVLTAQQSVPRKAQSEPPVAVSSTPARLPGAEQIRKTVAFIGVTYQDGTVQRIAIGTCFFVSLPDERVGKDGQFIYLVTSRHVAQPGIDLGTPYQTRRAILRMNLTNPQAEVQSVEGEIPLSESLHWNFPADDAVDLAILPLAPDHSRFDYMVIPLAMIVNAEQMKSGDPGIGDSVTFAGYFSDFPGRFRMEPIMRQGILAMLPGEKMPTTLHKPGQIYLADLHAFHGNSGSPVFANVGGFHHGSIIASDRYRLVGILSGYYPESAEYSVPAASILTGQVRDNSGIATIVPAEELLKLLNSAELQAQRDKVIETIHRKP
jgi:hypothetical protein